ncbi:alpha-ketoglutarate-dependent dioxygenase AlkB family protein [Gilvimarinus xylanilyticus]|uniref:Alpha-ketoglutarate-dependent dioxygenase AlkB n=1 Tax=Gilvimarinus xylanilyticus TaxID=2944139 RepID=A0A9X2KSF4_9GAMM|nr:alpha-ketoglutarate-dependent dioxygenase AlkB [Gilvimarinus xylanilyticus]MCP8898781.1 alpha-ketoglutarate-dependent dioxygenase AlkB [Gilvimarinus xylanilyticus]
MNQSDLFTHPGPETLITEDGHALVYRHWLDPKRADDSFTVLKETLAWEQSVLMMYGKRVAIPRLNAWYGDTGSRYQYSGAYFSPLPWTAELSSLRDAIQTTTGFGYNSVLANLYRNGADGVAWHSDDEPELGPEPAIASLSLGQTRRFTLRHKTNGHRVAVDLQHGDLLLMHGPLQRFWQHQIAKSKKPLGPRINLTYRWVVSSSQGV